ncbi:hypothetical protein HerbRD11066_08840 [Herbidospora sp. RD11066]
MKIFWAAPAGLFLSVIYMRKAEDVGPNDLVDLDLGEAGGSCWKSTGFTRPSSSQSRPKSTRSALTTSVS